ncbi:hypothetical protein BBK36DRAFT_1167940 [Trichoderma citrinoviride]|uniref:C3H1-type domain-containing protein n=1 Tax=Trichoderma citrinoviride TaxID=58853 RepID=A0A2T4BE49_9HYPO|nr:hypothetical protein BBK36DRAFT_1167940 [Trichoderma citrinoviride]PTB67548.1 hypothetical protein BBK36DRAFT_1167940 [Trichoderma citrinoviride]
MAEKVSSGVAASGLGNFFQRFQGLQSHRNAMDDLIRDLLIHCNQVESDLREESQRLVSAHIDLANAVNAGRELQQLVEFYEEQEERTQERTLKEIEKVKKHNSYVMVLIDGDGLVFRETYIKQGLEGGKKAAYALRSAVAEIFGEDAEDLEIVAKVVANLSGLGKAMQRDGCLDNPSLLKDFTLGFTQAKASFDYIDVGHGKERADSKIRARWHLRNHNCRHILLGISHDSGYAPFLDETLQSEATRQRISIIEGVATVPDLRATNVSIKRLGHELFREDKLLDKISSPRQHSISSVSGQPVQAAQPAPAPQPVAKEASSPVASPAVSTASSKETRTPVVSYAGIASASPPPKITLPLARKQTSGSDTSRNRGSQRSQQEGHYILIPPSQPQNWNPGPRGLDEPIRVNVQVLEAIKKRKEDKLCNNHYLRGPCAKRDTCSFVHDHKITDDEMKAVAVLARQNPCSSGQYCEADDCIYGHHCPSIRNGVCQHFHCRFSEEAHPPGTEYKGVF